MTLKRQVILLLVVSWSLLSFGCQNKSTVEVEPSVNDTQGEMTDKISEGEEILLEFNASTQKQAGADAYRLGNYQQAVSLWSSSLEQQRNDPETLIYLNNARIGEADAYSIAVAVPGDTEINVAHEILRGVAQAQFQINSSGGLNGKQVKLIIANDRNNPQVAQELARVFSQDPEILGVIGHFSSNVTLEAAQVYQTEELVVISPTSTSVALSHVGSYIFRTVPSDCVSGNSLATYLLKEMEVSKTAVLFNSASNYSTSMRDVFKSSVEKQQGKVVAEFNFSQPNFNIINVLNKIEQEGAEAIAIFPNSSGMNALETIDKTFLIAQINQRKLPLLGGDSLYKPRTLQLGQNNMLDMVLAVPWHTDNNDTTFTNLATNLWGGEVNWRSTLTYDAAIALATAIKTNPTRQGIQQALLAPDFTAEGASGEITFSPTGDRLGEVQLVKIQAGNSSGFGYDFVPVTDFAYSVPEVCR